MKIVIDHLTRMHGGHICVAGVDVDTRRHVRPVMKDFGMPFHFLSRYGGPFDMARIVDLGNPRSVADPPHIEDHVYVPSWAKVERTVNAHEFWSLLQELTRTKLHDLFGAALRKAGRSVSAETAWRVLLAAKDTPYSRTGTKWERLVRALEPMPDWAAERIGRMDIEELGALSAALIRGPYRSM